MNELKENIRDNFGTRMNNTEENTVEDNWTYVKKDHTTSNQRIHPTII